jgi:drug/metabolite transporter (DMT)-like permease
VRRDGAGGGSGRAATAGGFVAIALWATTIAVVGSLAQGLGVWLAAGVTYGVAGGLGWLLGGARARGWRRLPRVYVLTCGALFVAYMVLLTAAIGAARGASDLAAVSMLNYLWPALTVALSVPLLGYRASGWLWPSLLLGSGGAWLVIAGDDPRAAWADPNLTAWLCAAGAALAWAGYSNLTRRLCAGHTEDAVPVFMLASSLVIAVGGVIAGDDLLALGRADALTWAALLYMAALPGWLAYGLWDRAMRAGNHTLVAAASYATPLASALAIAAVHGLALSWQVVAAALLVLAGGLGSRASVRAV